jgi:4-hydroxybenzoate polyprenyltransferase
MADTVHPIVTYGRMIAFSHSIFAMPFALASTWIAFRASAGAGSDRPWWGTVALIVVCMVLARSCAMGVNRIVDRAFDARNPRTANRELPAGKLSLPAARGLTAAAGLGFIAASWAINAACGWLSPVALAVVCGYSYAKRFTALVHLWLGVALGLAPVAAWLAVTGAFAGPAVLLGVAVATWVAGFDVLYSLQDEAFDRGAGLHSIPARLGQVGALWVSGGLHLLTSVLLACVPASVEAQTGGSVALGWPYWVGWAFISGVLAWEHWIVRPGDLSRIDKAFFDMNGYVGVGFLAAVLACAWV